MSLQEEAENFTKKFKLPELFDDLGETHLIGNVALRTTVKPDIDVQIYAEPNNWEENSKTIIQRMNDFGLDDFITRNLVESGKFLTSFAFCTDAGVRWTIDITQTTPTDDFLKDGYTFYKKYQPLLSEEKVDTIKKLKTYFLNKDMLHHSMSYYIYRAVLDCDAKNVQDIYNYLTENKIYLKKFKKKIDRK